MRKSWFLMGVLLIALAAAAAPLRVYAQANAASNDKAAIQELEKRYIDAFNARDINAIMKCYAPGKSLFVFDAVPPREYPSWDSYKKDWEGLFAAYPGPLGNAISEQSITVVGSVAYGHNIQTGYFTRKDGSRVDVVVRVTDVYRKIRNQWLIVQEHVSFPADIDSGKADLLSKP